MFDIEAFLNMGASLLESNKMPENALMKVIKDTSIGIDLFMIGLARGQANSIKRVFKAMDSLEEEIFSDEFLEDRSDYEKIQLYKQAMESYKFRTGFVQDVQKQIDWTHVKAEALKLSTPDIGLTNSSKSKKTDAVKGLLKQMIVNERKNEN